MEELFKVVNLEQMKKVGLLKIEAHSNVKSTKLFPIYIIDGKKMIFKPLSKTKPLTTPLFAYSEVYWSYIINKYFDNKTPRYYLAITNNIENEYSKYYNKGVLVESITPNNEKLTNIYDYYIEHPDNNVNIKDYINYCMKNYDYTNILLSDFIINNENIGKDLAYQILLSILRQDQNFHYENINFINKNKKMVLAPPIDFEFSTPFLYPDNENKYNKEKIKYINDIIIKYDEPENDKSKILKQICLTAGISLNSILTNNICLIVKLYPDIVLKFINNLDNLIKDLPQIIINDPNNFVKELNSDYWQIGHAYYKENNLEKYNKLKEQIKLNEINKDLIFKSIKDDILSFSKLLNLTLKTYLFSYNNNIDDLENLTIKKLLNKLDIKDNFTIEDIDIKRKTLKLILEK